MNQINEALAQWETNDEGMPFRPLVAAARAYVRDWVTCPTCGGSGKMMLTTVSQEEAFDGVTPLRCPDCVDGMTPSPEAKRRAGRTIYEANLSTPSFDNRGRMVPFEDSPNAAEFEAAGLAVLLASRREGETR